MRFTYCPHCGTKSTLQYNGKLVTISGHHIHIYTQGNKEHPKLILMSGSGTIAPVYDFKVLYEKLTAHFRIIVIEKFGYGYSDIFESPCDIDSLVGMQRQALAAVGEIGPYILAPHSMSGLEAIRWKQTYPEEVTAIIGLDMAMPGIYQSWTEQELERRMQIIKWAGKFKFASILSQLNHRSLTKEEIAQHKLLRKRNAFNRCILNEGYAIFSNVETICKDGKIQCPTLLFSSNGKQTSSGWLEHQQNFASDMNAKLICYDCGHYLHHFKSEEMSKEILAFVNGIEQ